MRFLGIDISKRTFHAALMNGKKFLERSPKNNQAGIEAFVAWLGAQTGEPIHACMEATGTYWEDLARALVAAGHTVSVVNPKFIHNFASTLNLRSKTDAVDARLIARYAEKMQPEPWVPPPAEQYAMRQLIRRRQELTRQLVQETNRLKSGCLHPLEQASLEKMMGIIEAEIAEMERQIRQLVKQHDGLKHQQRLLLSIPGIGEVVSWTLIARLRPIEAYSSAKQLAAFIGVTPKERSSGTSVRGRSKMCKIGDAELRWLLYMAALSCRRNSNIQAFVDRLARKGKSKMLILGALMRKLAHAAYGVLKYQQPFDADKAFPALV